MIRMLIGLFLIHFLIQKHDNSNGVVGDTREVEKFLLKPTVIGDDKRFLTRAKILQEYYKTPCGEYRWINKKWLS